MEMKISKEDIEIIANRKDMYSIGHSNRCHATSSKRGHSERFI